jgi:hypothetical protein
MAYVQSRSAMALRIVVSLAGMVENVFGLFFDPLVCRVFASAVPDWLHHGVWPRAQGSHERRSVAGTRALLDAAAQRRAAGDV